MQVGIQQFSAMLRSETCRQTIPERLLLVTSRNTRASLRSNRSGSAPDLRWQSWQQEQSILEC